MKTWQAAAALAVAALCGVPLCGVLAACGGGGSDGTPTKYTDSTYGFTITIPAGYEKDATDSSTEPGAYVVAWAQSDAPRASGQRVNTIEIGAREEGHTMSTAEIAAEIAAMRGDTLSLEDSMGDNALVSHTEEMSIAGAPALVVDVTRDAPNGSLVDTRVAYIFSGSVTYVIRLSAFDQSWKDNEADLQGALASFTTS